MPPKTANGDKTAPRNGTRGGADARVKTFSPRPAGAAAGKAAPVLDDAPALPSATTVKVSIPLKSAAAGKSFLDALRAGAGAKPAAAPAKPRAAPAAAEEEAHHAPAKPTAAAAAPVERARAATPEVAEAAPAVQPQEATPVKVVEAPTAPVEIPEEPVPEVEEKESAQLFTAPVTMPEDGNFELAGGEVEYDFVNHLQPEAPAPAAPVEEIPEEPLKPKHTVQYPPQLEYANYMLSFVAPPANATVDARIEAIQMRESILQERENQMMHLEREREAMIAKRMEDVAAKESQIAQTALGLQSERHEIAKERDSLKSREQQLIVQQQQLQQQQAALVNQQRSVSSNSPQQAAPAPSMQQQLPTQPQVSQTSPQVQMMPSAYGSTHPQQSSFNPASRTAMPYTSQSQPQQQQESTPSWQQPPPQQQQQSHYSVGGHHASHQERWDHDGNAYPSGSYNNNLPNYHQYDSYQGSSAMARGRGSYNSRPQAYPGARQQFQGNPNMSMPRPMNNNMQYRQNQQFTPYSPGYAQQQQGARNMGPN